MAYGYGGMGISMDQKVAAGAIAGGLIGAIQTQLLREYADNPMATGFLKNTSGSPPLLMAQLKGFGSPSALVGIIAGGVAAVIGLVGLLKRKIIHHGGLAAGLASYGLVALTTGVISGALPTVQWSAATLADPNNPIGTPTLNRQQTPLQVMRASAQGTTIGA